MSAWDVNRGKAKGVHDVGVPTCSKCGATSVLDPCRSCANTHELELLPPAPK